MTAPAAPESLNADGGMVFGTERSRLAAHMEVAGTAAEDDVSFAESPASLTKFGRPAGIDNPFGSGLGAYEPHTVIFDGYDNAYGAVQQSKAEEEAAKQTFTTIQAPSSAGTPPIDATGKIGAAIQAALQLATRRVMYVWGGTSAQGVDCSGLIAYAFRAAGIVPPGSSEWPRYRAVDYGRMGVAITKDQARPGDIVYYDEPGDTDHVGIYLGNGKMVQAPQSGQAVQISNVGNATSYRRVFDDGQFQQVATPEGGAYWAYGGNRTTWAQYQTTSPTDTVRRTSAPNRTPFGA